MPGSSLPPPRAVGAGAAAAAPQCGGGAGAGEDPGPGHRGRKTLGWEQRGRDREGRGSGCPGSPPASALPSTPLADTLTHTHPRWAGADVSLKASHLHREGRGLVEAADRGLQPHVAAPRETPSFGAAGGRVPCPALTPLPSPRPPCPPSPSARTELAWGQGPPPAFPRPPWWGPRPSCQTAFCFLGASLLGGTHSLPSPPC